jgi:hypothetical protein
MGELGNSGEVELDFGEHTGTAQAGLSVRQMCAYIPYVKSAAVSAKRHILV